MGMQVESRGTRAPLAEINVTPLVDVMLVLLIIFMVAAPMMTHGVDVQLPTTQAEALPQPQEPLVLSIDKAGAVYLDGTRLPGDDVALAVRTNRRLKDAEELFVEADEAVPYGVVVRIFAAVKAAGIAKVGLITNPEVLAAQPEAE